jgi:hypothetical protein
VSLSAPSEILDGKTKYVCTGWRTTDASLSGSGTTAVFTAKNNLTLTWLWEIYDYIDVSVVGYGSTSCTPGWVRRGSRLNIEGIPVTTPIENESFLAGWNVNGEFIRNPGVDTGSYSIEVAGPQTIELQFETYAHFYQPRK